MSLDHWVPLFSTAISFSGLLIVIHQLRVNNKQRELGSLVHVFDINRQLLSLGFAHPKLFEIMPTCRMPTRRWNAVTSSSG